MFALFVLDNSVGVLQTSILLAYKWDITILYIKSGNACYSISALCIQCVYTASTLTVTVLW